jgi:hypothetical protein
MMKKTDMPTRATRAKHLAAVYLGSFLIWAVVVVIRQRLHYGTTPTLNQMLGPFTLLMAALFPSGLIGVVSPVIPRSMILPMALGYAVYITLFLMAMRATTHRGYRVILSIFILVVVVNYPGCSRMMKVQSQRTFISPP